MEAQDRIEAKLDRLADSVAEDTIETKASLASFSVSMADAVKRLAAIELDLKEHMRRTEALEKIVGWWKMVVGAALVSMASGRPEILQFLKDILTKAPQ